MISAIVPYSVMFIAGIEIETLRGVVGGQQEMIQMFLLEPNVQRYLSSPGQTIGTPNNKNP